ncbi:MAG: ABC-F family ATP-binding cassette domain-containing protein [Flavobacteriales bacterium]
MNILQAEKVSKSFGDRVLFRDVTFGLNHGQKLALVGSNGTGKSTLLSILNGKEIPDEGKVTMRKDIRMAFLPQQPEFNPEHTVSEALFHAGNPALDAISDYEACLEMQQSNPDPEVDEKLQACIRKIDELKAWDIEAKVAQILGKLNIHQLEQKMGTLSGGQRKRVALAELLINEPELLILDEPTNHLDIEMIEWLEYYLSQSKLSLLMVSHDRYFMDKVCSGILELDRKQLFYYKGNYAYYLEKKAQQQFVENREIEKARNLLVKELEWMRRMPKARGTKSKARIDAFYDLKETADKRMHEKQVQLEVKMNRLGSKILELIKISKNYGEQKIIEPFTYTFKKGEKIGIVGRNGSGKSTFLNILTGAMQSDTGKVVVGETIVFGYYQQEKLPFSDDKRVIEVVRDIADVIPMANGTHLSASQLLQLFLFSPDMQYNYVSKLSGGEKRRLFLCTVLMNNPNFLILDEPTNDLDIPTLNVLEDFLENFQGCVIIVSHDRYFLDRICDHLFIFEGEGRIRDFNGNYTDYREEVAQIQTEKKQESEKGKGLNAKTEAPKTEKRKPSYKEQREYEQLESEIAALEKENKELETKLSEGNLSLDELNRISQRIGEINAALDTKTNRWLELAEIIGV